MLPDNIAPRFSNSVPKHDYHGLKIEVSELGNPTLWSETDQINPTELFEWLLGKEAITSIDGRGLFDSIFKVLSRQQIKELAVLGKTYYDGIRLTIPGSAPWLSVSRGSDSGKLTNLYTLFKLNKEFPEFTEPSQFRKGAELARVKLWNYGLGDVAVRSPGQLIEALSIRKVFPYQELPIILHVERFANSFKPARTEGTTFGINEVVDYDLTSAFPSEISNLIDLTQIYWIDSDKMQDEAIYAAIKCDLDINQPLIRGPISVRYGENSSFFPIGKMNNIWISKPEIDLLRKYPELGKITKIHEGSWGILKDHSQSVRQPFKRLLSTNLFRIRQHDAYLSGYIKLTMAALWGKFISTYPVVDSFDEESYLRSSCLYNPIFASHVTARVRCNLYEASLGKEIVGEFVDGIALIDSVRIREGFGGLVEEGKGTMVLFDDQYKGCDWKNPEILYHAQSFKDKTYIEVPRSYRASLPYSYQKFGETEARLMIAKEIKSMQHIPLGPSRRLIDSYKVGDYLEYSIPSAPPRMTDLLPILYERGINKKIR